MDERMNEWNSPENETQETEMTKEPAAEEAAQPVTETPAAEEVAAEAAQPSAEAPAAEETATEAADRPRPQAAPVYTVQNPNPYYHYAYTAPQTVTPVAVKKKKNPLIVALIIVSALLIVSLIASMGAILVLRRQAAAPSSGGAGTSQTEINNDKDTSDIPENPSVTVSQKEKKDASVMTTEEVAAKVTPQVVGIVASTGEGWYASQDQGSGIIFSEDGYIITNHHVIDGSTGVKVVLADGKDTTYDAKIIGSDSKTDLAVLKVDATGLDAADIGSSAELKVGETVLAIGNPYGLQFASSVTAGIVSALERNVTIENSQMTLIQTDAAINPGNSGGALVNLYGQVVGINSSKISDTAAEGLGFSIPIDDALPIIQELISKGYISGRPMIGIQGQDVSNQMALMYNIPVGVYVSYIDETSDAYKQGLRSYDIITEFNGEQVTSFAELDAAKSKCKAGDTVEIRYYRYETGKYSTIKITLSESTGEKITGNSGNNR